MNNRSHEHSHSGAPRAGAAGLSALFSRARSLLFLVPLLLAAGCACDPVAGDPDGGSPGGDGQGGEPPVLTADGSGWTGKRVGDRGVIEWESDEPVAWESTELPAGWAFEAISDTRARASGRFGIGGYVLVEADTEGLSNPGFGGWVPDKVIVSDDGPGGLERSNTVSGPCTRRDRIESEERFRLDGPAAQRAFSDEKFEIWLADHASPPEGRCRERDRLVSVRLQFH